MICKRLLIRVFKTKSSSFRSCCLDSHACPIYHLLSSSTLFTYRLRPQLRAPSSSLLPLVPRVSTMTMRLVRCCALLLLATASDAQLLAPLMSLASNLNPFHGIASSLTGGGGGGSGGGGLRGGLLSSLRGAASNNVGLPVRGLQSLVAPPVPAPQLPPFPAAFGE